jgi:predicted permease
MMFGWRRRQIEFAKEIESHLELEVDRLKEEGLSEKEANARARRNFGNVTLTRERRFESSAWSTLESFFQDVRFGSRVLRKTPSSTVIAVCTLALGIGATTSIFTLVNAVLLRKLPVPQANELMLFGKGTWVGSQDTLPDRSWQLFSYPFYQEFREKNEVFRNVAAIDSILFESHGRVGSGSELERIRVELISGSYFETLGLHPATGRLLSDGDDEKPGGHPVAVASYSWWQRRFSKVPGAIGTSVAINGTLYNIIGVAPQGFSGITLGQEPDLWIPLAMEAQISPGWNGLENKLFQSLYVLVRRKPEVTIAQAAANTNVLFKQILHETAGQRPTPDQVKAIDHARIELTHAATGLPGLRVGFSAPLKILMILVALLLVMSCVNVANLLLARSAARYREIAVRMSLGAGRNRLIRQLLVECGLLALSGAVAGVLIAWTGSHVLLSMVAPAGQSLSVDVTPDTRVLGFALGSAIITVLLSGMAPAICATRFQPNLALKEGRGQVGVSSRNGLRLFVIGQVSVSVILLAGAGLFLRSFLNLMNVDTGFDKQNVIVIGLDPNAAGYRADVRLENSMADIEERVSALPRVNGASFAFSIFGGGWTSPVRVPGRNKSDNDRDVFHDIVGPEYLPLMRVPVVIGRGLNRRDNARSAKVAVINEAMAQTYFPGISPIGQTFSAGPELEWQNIQVIGVVKNAKYMDLKERSMPAAFYPHAQHPMFLYNLLVRCAGDTSTLISQIRRTIRSVDPNLPVGDVTTLAALVNDSVRNQRVVAQLSTFFGVLAAMMACIGIYGVVSHGVTQRTSEFGIRMALGAMRADVLCTVLRDVLRMALLGVIIAIPFPLAASFSPMLQSQVYGLKPDDPLTIGVAVSAMVLVAVLAAYWPARRATYIDPMLALRYE